MIWPFKKKTGLLVVYSPNAEAEVSDLDEKKWSGSIEYENNQRSNKTIGGTTLSY